MSTEALVILGLGLLPAAYLALAAVWTLLGPLRLRARGEGTVVGLDLATLGDPVVEFVAVDGSTVRYVDHVDGYLHVGDRVPLRYSPRAPQRARVATPAATYLRPLLMLALAPLVASLAWTTAKRVDRVPPADRVAAYVPLSASLDALDACARRACAASTMRRRLRAYDRDRVAAAAVASPPVAARIAALQRSLTPARRGTGRPRAAPIAALSRTLSEELQQLLVGHERASAVSAGSSSGGPSRGS